MQKKYKNVYLNNINYFKKNHHNLYIKLTNYNEKENYSLKIEDYLDGKKQTKVANIEILSNNQMAYQSNPLENAKTIVDKALVTDKWFNNIVENNINKIIFISNGLGYHLPLYDKKFDLKSILIVEDNIEIFKLSLYTVDYKLLSKNKKISFCINETTEVLESYILSFYYSLFFYNSSIKLSECFNNNTTSNIINIFKNKVDADRLTAPTTYQSILLDDNFKIDKNNYKNILDSILKDIFEDKKFPNHYLPLTIRLIDYFNENQEKLNNSKTIIPDLYYCLFHILSLANQLNKSLEDIKINALNYLIILSKLGKIDKHLLSKLIFITKSTKQIDNEIYFYKELIKYLKANENKTSKEKENIKYHEYLFDILTGKTKDNSSNEFVKVEFDSFAKTFENKLVNTLEYKIPTIISEQMKQHIDLSKKYDLLDLGCGTGLMGVELQTISNNIIGIDLSPEMLKITEEKNIYTELIEIGIEEYLIDLKNLSLEIVTATDVFVYIGDLDNIFSELSNKLIKNGIFAFSIESLDSDTIDFRLNDTVRFSHSKHYIRKLCDKFNFTILEESNTVIRKEKNEDVAGFIYILKLSDK